MLELSPRALAFLSWRSHDRVQNARPGCHADVNLLATPTRATDMGVLGYRMLGAEMRESGE
jgi:hypothetical protein